MLHQRPPGTEEGGSTCTYLLFFFARAQNRVLREPGSFLLAITVVQNAPERERVVLCEKKSIRFASCCISSEYGSSAARWRSGTPSIFLLESSAVPPALPLPGSGRVISHNPKKLVFPGNYLGLPSPVASPVVLLNFSARSGLPFLQMGFSTRRLERQCGGGGGGASAK